VFEQRSPVGDVALGDRHREHRRALPVPGGPAAEGLDGLERLPALEQVDAARVEQVGRGGKVQTAICLARAFSRTLLKAARHDSRCSRATVTCPATMTMGALLAGVSCAEASPISAGAAMNV
jgi:hypothetical protein